MTSAVSNDEGATWGHVENIETEPVHHDVAPWDGYAYTSITFVGDRALLTYYVSGMPTKGVKGNNTWALKLKSIPVRWFYE